VAWGNVQEKGKEVFPFPEFTLFFNTGEAFYCPAAAVQPGNITVSS
jgi:hypothetical protein